MDIMRCILKIIPDYRCIVYDNDYNRIKILEGENRPLPTLIELQAVTTAVDAEIASELQANDDEKSMRGGLFKILFSHENRIRVLEGKAEITKAQFRAAIQAIIE